MLLGKFKAYLFPLISFLSGTLSIIICYYLSQYFHQEKPFPNTWISATADHYPGFIVFRIGTIAGAVFVIFSYFMEYFWIYQISRQHVFHIKKYWPGLGATIGISGAMFLMASTANLDTGQHNDDWHIFCASNFFVMTILAMWYYTAISAVLYFYAKAGDTISIVLKIVGSLLILFQIYLESFAIQSNVSHDKINSPLSNALEYSIAFSLLSFFLIFAYDLRNYEMAYMLKK